jgi:hypothetical protein
MRKTLMFVAVLLFAFQLGAMIQNIRIGDPVWGVNIVGMGLCLAALYLGEKGDW